MLTAGTRLGRHAIVELLGAGGMGEVYRARDERLERDVAIKVLPAEVAGDPDRLARFEREAKALARLSHPNILAIHEFGQSEGTSFAVTELLEGETLRETLREGPLPWRRAVEVGAAIADGLAAAHAQGIVHRDLKPENVFVTDDGRVKVLDFGLAKFLLPEVSTSGVTVAPTAPPTTAPGVVLGTVGYMSPEQVRGEPADHRSDIFSLGCVLYEMLTGRSPYRRDTAAETMTAILRDEPPKLSSLRPEAPARLGESFERCLAKRQEQRFQSAADLGFALRSAVDGAGRPERASRSPGGELPSIAVLPFANLSADPEQEFFCDGVAEEIINALAHVEGMHVLARTSSFALKRKNVDVREIGAKFNVSTVLDGSVRKASDRLRITAQLIDVASGYHLWSERFDRRLEDIFAIQDEIALAVTENLKVRLVLRERAALSRRYTGNLEAHNAYLLARYEWNRMVPEGFARSRELYEEAIRLDPGFASALVELANWYLSQAFWAYLEPAVVVARGLPLLERAMALDPESAEAHVVWANVAGFLECRWDEAEKMLRRAIAFAPSLVEAHLYLGGQLLVRGRLREAAEENRVALSLDPVSPTRGAWAASWLAHSGAHDEGIAELERLLAMYPGHWLVHWALAHTLAQVRPARARDEAEKAVELSGGAAPALSIAACLSHVTGDTQRGELLRERLEGLEEHGYVAPVLLAWVELARGETTAAMAWFDKARRNKDPMLPFTRLGFGALYPHHEAIEAFVERLVE